MRLNEIDPNSREVEKQGYAKSLANLIRTNCLPYLELTKANTPDPNWLFRGIQDIPSNQNLDLYLRPRTVRTDRLPRDTRLPMHRIADNWFLENIGWNARSSGLFCQHSLQTLNSYGEVCIIFPIGKFDYLFSPEIKDLTVELNSAMFFPQDNPVTDKLPDNKKLTATITSILSKGRWQFNENFDTYCSTYPNFEMILRCSSYYAIPIQRSGDNICWNDVMGYVK